RAAPQLHSRGRRPVQPAAATAAASATAVRAPAGFRKQRRSVTGEWLANAERALIGPSQASLFKGFLNMRAEAQAHIDQINAATALLRRFLDWDRAARRLEELNAKVEDPSLWE